MSDSWNGVVLTSFSSRYTSAPAGLDLHVESGHCAHRNRLHTLPGSALLRNEWRGLRRRDVRLGRPLRVIRRGDNWGSRGSSWGNWIVGRSISDRWRRRLNLRARDVRIRTIRHERPDRLVLVVTEFGDEGYATRESGHKSDAKHDRPDEPSTLRRPRGSNATHSAQRQCPLCEPIRFAGPAPVRLKLNQPLTPGRLDADATAHAGESAQAQTHSTDHPGVHSTDR